MRGNLHNFLRKEIFLSTGENCCNNRLRLQTLADAGKYVRTIRSFWVSDSLNPCYANSTFDKLLLRKEKAAPNCTHKFRSKPPREAEEGSTTIITSCKHSVRHNKHQNNLTQSGLNPKFIQKYFCISLLRSSKWKFTEWQC